MRRKEGGKQLWKWNVSVNSNEFRSNEDVSAAASESSPSFSRHLIVFNFHEIYQLEFLTLHKTGVCEARNSCVCKEGDDEWIMNEREWMSIQKMQIKITIKWKIATFVSSGIRRQDKFVYERKWIDQNKLFYIPYFATKQRFSMPSKRGALTWRRKVSAQNSINHVVLRQARRDFSFSFLSLSLGQNKNSMRHSTTSQSWIK